MGRGIELPDLILHTMTQGSYPADTVLSLWTWLREVVGVPTASIHLDRFYGLSSPKDSGPQRADLPRLHPMFKVDHVFTADGDSDDLFARDGVNHHWLPPGVRHDEARDIEPTDEDRARFGGFSVGFCGARGYHPEHDRAGLIDALEARYGDRFVRVAGDTKYGTVRGEALNRMYATVPVWVGDSCFAGTSSRYTSDRFFETWGRGGFLVHPRLRGVEEIVGGWYPNWEPYEDHEALFQAIDHYSHDWDDNPRAVRARLATEVRRCHTYVNRVAEMLDTIGLDRPDVCCLDHALPLSRYRTDRAIEDAYATPSPYRVFTEEFKTLERQGGQELLETCESEPVPSPRHRIRVAQLGWDDLKRATTRDEVRTGVGVQWVEIDGHRIPATAIAGVKFELDHESFATTEVSLIGAVEIVYVDQDGEELP